MEITIESFEGGFYLAYERINSSQRVIKDAENHPVRFNSLEQAHNYFGDMGSISAWLVHNTPYEEMIGCQVNDDKDFRIPLGW